MGDNVTPGPMSWLLMMPFLAGKGMFFFGGECHFFLETLSSGFFEKESF